MRCLGCVSVPVGRDSYLEFEEEKIEIKYLSQSLSAGIPIWSQEHYWKISKKQSQSLSAGIPIWSYLTDF